MSIARTARRIAVSIAWIAGSAFAQDDCANAVTIIAGLTAGSTIGLSSDTVTGCGISHDDHWFVYAALCTGTATASVCIPGAASFDTILAAYDGSGGCGSLVPLACNDDFCGTRSEIAFPVVAGGVYYVAIGSAQAFGGIFTMLLTCAAVVPNDECAGALTIGSGVTAGTNFGATNSTQDQGGVQSDLGSDVWYRYTAACNGFVEATLCQPGSASFDTILAVFDGSAPCGSLMQIACNDDTCLLRSRVLFPVSSGSSYLIVVGGFSAAQGTFSLAITCHQPPAEDDCSGAIPLALGTNGPFSNQFATDGQPPASACPLGFGDVWFTFTPACAGTHRISACGGYDTVLSVRDGCAGSAEIACGDDGPAGCAPGPRSTSSRPPDSPTSCGSPARAPCAGRSTSRSRGRSSSSTPPDSVRGPSGSRSPEESSAAPT